LAPQWHEPTQSKRQECWLDCSNCGSSRFTAGDYDLYVGWGINPFAGDMREFRIWDRARSQAEVGRDFNRVLTGNEPSTEPTSEYKQK
jgi:hypothetical protein